MKRYIKSSHNPYPTTTFEVLAWDNGDTANKKLTKSFNQLSDATDYAKSLSSCRLVRVFKETAYDDIWEHSSDVLLQEYKHGSQTL